MLSTTFTSYFHVVFTVPDQIADIALQNKRTVYEHSLPSHCGHTPDHCRRPQTSRSTNWFLCRSSHLGAKFAAPSASALRRSRRRTLSRRHPMDWVPPGFLFARARAISSFPALILDPSQAGFRVRPPAVLWLAKETARPPRIPRLPRSGGAEGMGRLRQAAVCWTTTSTRLCRPLHPSRCHFQQPLTRYRTQSGEVSVERLPRQRPPKDNDPIGRRVHSKILDSCLARRVPTHPLLWVSQQLSPK